MWGADKVLTHTALAAGGVASKTPGESGSRAEELLPGLLPCSAHHQASARRQHQCTLSGDRLDNVNASCVM